MTRTTTFAALLTLPLLGLAAAPTPQAHAAIVFTATLTNAQEVPPAFPTTTTGAPRPASFGTATFTLNDAQTALAMSVTIFNIDVTGSQTADINDNLTAGHIHAAAPPGVVAPVVWGFFGAPNNDNNPNNLVLAPFATGVGGVITSVWNEPEGNNTSLPSQLHSLLAGLAYLNIHTTQFPGGEIRGQIISPVPEPSSLLLFGAAGLLALASRIRPQRG